MAGLLDQLGLGGLDERFQRFSTNPLGMASLGLLLQPRRRPVGSSGFDYALQGMQAAEANQQNQFYRQRAEEEMKARQQEQERQARVMQMLSAGATPEERALMASMSPEEFMNYQKYKMDITNDQQKRIEIARAEKERKRQVGALSQVRDGLSGPERLAFDALPLNEQIKIAAQAFKPAEMTSAERNALALGLKPGSAEYNEYIRAATLPSSPTTINLGKVLTPTELGGLELPGGGQIPLGTTIEQAASLGATPIPKPPTEGQALSAGFYERMSQANAAITPEREQLLSQASEAIAARTPLIGNYLSSPEYQVARQAQEDFVTAVLRKESGAVIGEQEMENAIRKYFPQPGDKQEVIQQKRKLRNTETQSMRRGAGRAFQAPTQSPMITPAGVSVTPNFNGGQQSIEDIARKYLK